MTEITVITRKVGSRLFFCVLLVLTGFLFSACSVSQTEAAGEAAEIEEQFQAAVAETLGTQPQPVVPEGVAADSYTFAVQEVLCSDCVREIESLVRAIEGVDFLFIDSTEQTVQVFFEPAILRSSAVIIDELAGWGYHASLLKEKVQ